VKFWATITGSDLTREWKAFETRAGALPAGHRAAWDEIKGRLSLHSDFTGRNLIPVLDGVLALLEETAADGRGVHEVLGDDIEGFCAALAGGHGNWAGWEADMGIRDIIAGKRQWRAHVARVRALPPDYRIVYKEIQRYFFKVGPVDLLDGIVDFFEEGVVTGRGVLELVGDDVAAFCDGLITGSRTS
jgi:DNA-binding ferritin-like protein (Dps family)